LGWGEEFTTPARIAIAKQREKTMTQMIEDLIDKLKEEKPS
jgi:hypothetical protein